MRYTEYIKKYSICNTKLCISHVIIIDTISQYVHIFKFHPKEIIICRTQFNCILNSCLSDHN